MSRSSKPKKLPKDPNQLAAAIVRISTESSDESPKTKRVLSAVSQYLAKIGRAGGLKGGKARAKRLDAKERTAIARKAAKARWTK